MTMVFNLLAPGSQDGALTNDRMSRCIYRIFSNIASKQPGGDFFLTSLGTTYSKAYLSLQRAGRATV